MIEYGGPLLYHGGEDEQEIVRFHLPQVPPVPQRDGSLTLAVTHKFPDEAKL